MTTPNFEILKFSMLTHVCGVARVPFITCGAKHSLYSKILSGPPVRNQTFLTHLQTSIWNQYVLLAEDELEDEEKLYFRCILDVPYDLSFIVKFDLFDVLRRPSVPGKVSLRGIKNRFFQNLIGSISMDSRMNLDHQNNV